MKIYISNHVRQVNQLHESILKERSRFKKVIDLLSAMAENLFASFGKGEKATAIEISNYHPLFIGNEHDEIMSRAFTLEDAQLTIARAYGFQNWEAVNGVLNHDFEDLVDLVLDGKIDKLKELIALKPDLINQRSGFGHHATILHYAGSNGVEIWRQRVPKNLPEIVNWLLENGADKNAKAHFYGREHTALELASTSAHPKDAGILKELEEVFH